MLILEQEINEFIDKNYKQKIEYRNDGTLKLLCDEVPRKFLKTSIYDSYYSDKIVYEQYSVNILNKIFHRSIRTIRRLSNKERQILYDAIIDRINNIMTYYDDYVYLIKQIKKCHDDCNYLFNFVCIDNEHKIYRMVSSKNNLLYEVKYYYSETGAEHDAQMIAEYVSGLYIDYDVVIKSGMVKYLSYIYEDIININKELSEKRAMVRHYNHKLLELYNTFDEILEDTK